MSRMRLCWIVLLVIFGGFVWGNGAFAQNASDARDNTDAETKGEPQKDPAGDPAVNAWYERLVGVYMKAKWTEFKDQYKEWPKMRLKLSSRQRRDVIYMRSTAEEFHPSWWKYTRSPKNCSFKAQIWGRWFTANYMPSQTLLGEQRAVGIRRGRLQIVVSWQPTYVDNPKPFTNNNSFHVFIPDAKDYDFTIGTMAEVIVWHELGHNYVNLNLPLQQIIRLYNDYTYLFHHLQEFYADLTALYHAGPPGRLFTMRLRMMNLVDYEESSIHTRGCAHAVGALLTAKFLSEPDKWPSVHFPGKVPPEEVERYTILYLYRHIEPSWTLAEDRQLREFINVWVRNQGEKALRRKGRVSLPNGQTMMLLAGQDREYQRQRDRWIQRKLEEIIAAKRADDPKVFEKDWKDIENRARFVQVQRRRNRGEERTSRRRSEEPKKKEDTEKPQDDDLDDILGDPEEK
ncbi:MAG: hypothetical protein JXA11_05185 [Phycisphaerae bacterium]|nr:hypothetical protein [Phycisphaerae bacterium]